MPASTLSHPFGATHCWTGASHSFDGVTVVNGSAFTVRDITSHDLMLGVRWELESPPVYAPPPRRSASTAR